MLKKILATVVLLGATFSTQFAFGQFQDNSFRYWYSPDFRESDTNNGKNISKNILSFTHVDGGNKLGNNFLNVDMLKSNAGDPTASSSGTTTEGATEVYIVYRHDVSLDKVTNSKKFSFGPVKDVLITGGADLNTKNTEFAPEKRMPVFGPTFSLKVPHGFWDVSFLWDKEWNNNGIVGKGVEFKSAAMLASAWGFPFRIGKAPMSFEGFGTLNSTKGKDGFGNGTKPETLLHPKLMYNIGSLFSEKHNYSIGVGYEYWNNKFGNDNHANPGSCAHAPFAEVALHL
jgi:nucleoside-specific outer membrane channel protein Tsx